MAGRVDEEVFGLEISVDVTKLVEGIYGAKHLCDVESSVAVGKDTGIVEQGSEISTRDILLYQFISFVPSSAFQSYHCQIDALLVLEGIKQPHKPFALRICQDITLRKNMSNLIQLEQQLLAHNLQRTNLPSVLLLSEEDLSISALSNLCKNLEIPLAKTHSTLSQIGTLSTNIFLPDRIVCFFGSCWRIGEFGFEVAESVLSSSDVAQEVEVII